jgi:hypothetical protein
MLNIVRSFLKVSNTRSLASIPSAASGRIDEQLSDYRSGSRFVKPREVWVSNLLEEDDNAEGIKTLHPKIFADTPRIDIIHQNMQWQRNYRFVSFAHAKMRFECRGLFWFRVKGGKLRNLNEFQVEDASLGHRKVSVGLVMDPFDLRCSAAAASSMVHAHQPHISTCCRSTTESSVSPRLFQ